jgi:tetrahydromethanopterin S-methyltransferase subunit A
VSDATKHEFKEAISQLGQAAAARKCWSCGCLHGSLDSIELAFPDERKSKGLTDIIQAARRRLADVEYDCLGCEMCHPAVALDALGVDVEACPADAIQEREGWPPFPGSYSTLGYHASVAVCTLTDDKLAAEIARSSSEDLAVVGTLQTENLGIERLILNIVANPHIRFLLLCGADSRQTVGHLPGQSLVALARFGIDKSMRITKAKGKRPLLRNVTPEIVVHFRQFVEVLDFIGEESPPVILEAAAKAGARDPGPALPFAPERVVPTIPGYLPEQMVADPAGYFVVYPDRRRKLLLLEHYRNDGVLDLVLEDQNAAELYSAAIDKELLTRLDHAAYLGCELSRAEHALRTGDVYVQDRAPERGDMTTATNCGCDSSCGEKT